MRYPDTYTEDQTLDRVLAGASLARYGDGEYKVARGGSIKSQTADHRLAHRLRGILSDLKDGLLVGIPNINAPTPKREFWDKFRNTASMLGNQKFGSSFVTRPDSAPWIDRPDYWAKVESLWLGRDVTLVRGSSKSLIADDLVGAGNVTEILCPRQNAFAEYDSILKRIGKPERAILCLGPTATILAADLCARGVHAIDFGHGGLFLRKHRDGRPMWVTKEDKAA